MKFKVAAENMLLFTKSLTINMNSLKLKLLREIINTAPEKSVMVVNGLNYKHLSKKSFSVLFPNINIEREKLLYYIELNKNNRDILFQTIESEPENVFSDFVHFDVKIDSKVILRSYAQMKWVEFIPIYFQSIDAAKSILYDKIDFISSTKII